MRTRNNKKSSSQIHFILEIQFDRHIRCSIHKRMSNNKDDVVEGDVDIPTEPSGKSLTLPADVALLPIRNRVLLPGGLLRLTIGRPKSVS